MADYPQSLLPAPSWRRFDEPALYWKRKVEQSRMTPASGLLLGSNLASSLDVFLTPESLRTHVQVYGPTGVGKSCLIEALITAWH